MVDQDLGRDGFVVVRDALGPASVESMRRMTDTLAFASDERRRRGGHRLAVDHPLIRAFLQEPVTQALLERVIGTTAFATRALLFDKHAESNWTIRWHRDETIAVAQRHAVSGYGPWSIKNGVPHVRGPRDVLDAMVTLRLHLDDTGPHAGGLRVVPGSHRARLDEAVPSEEERAGSVCPELNAGDVLVMKPLLWHASEKLEGSGRRRVLHVEFASDPLPEPLAWNVSPPR